MRSFRSVQAKVDIRDAKDKSILDAAVAAAVDVIVTGDKDFHALEISEPMILTPRQYLELPGRDSKPAHQEVGRRLPLSTSPNRYATADGQSTSDPEAP